jgi:hypothetical protein
VCVFVGREVVLRDKFGCDGGFGHGGNLIKGNCLNGFIKWGFFITHQSDC